MGKRLFESRGEAEFSAELFEHYATQGPQLIEDQVLGEDQEGVGVLQRRSP